MISSSRLLQQAAHDLDPLALADRQRVHQAPRLERQPVALRHLLDAARQLPRAPPPSSAERDVLGDGQRLEQRKVLEHHADAQARAPAPGLAIVDRLAVPSVSSPASGRTTP